MSKCPIHKLAAKLRPGLPPLTERLKKLPLDERGYPVPFFVAWVDGKPEFRAADASKRHRCFKEKLCWVCGGKLGHKLAFVLGPMCIITRTTAEPPAHFDCAEWSVRGCPFLAKPQMDRRRDEDYDDLKTKMHARDVGVPIDRNPGVCAIWITDSYKLFNDGRGGTLINVGEVKAISWWCQGRGATRAEVEASIDSGLPILKSACPTPAEIAELEKQEAKARKLLPYI